MKKNNFLLIFSIILFFFSLCVFGKEGDDLLCLFNACSSKDFIILKSKRNPYMGNFKIKRDVFLCSSQNTQMSSGYDGNILLILFPYSIVKGIYFIHSGKNIALQESCIFIGKYANSTHVLLNQFFDCGFSLWLHNSNFQFIKKNFIIGTLHNIVSSRGNSIHIFSNKGTLIHNNIIIHGRDGVYVTTSKEVTIKKNLLINTRYGIHYMYSNACTVQNNKNSNSSVGFAIMYSKFVDILFNYVTENKEHGILLRDVYYSKIFLNRSFRNYEGVFFGSSYFNKIKENDILRNFIAVKISNGSDDNKVYKNNFIDNTIQVQLLDNRTFHWFGVKFGNYWSHYIGFDKNKDNVGDRIFYVTLISDWLVTMYPGIKIVFKSPVMLLLQQIEHNFPALRKSIVIDNFPLMKPWYNNNV